MTNDFEGTIRDLLLHMGENPDREGLRDTPRRVAESYRFLTKGYKTDPERLIKKALFTEPHDDLVIVKDIEFYSLCEHHLLPFFGKCHIGYIPNGSIIGLSKLCRLVEVYARRLQVQERMTNQIADVLNRHLKPKGVGVVLEAQHLCMQMRGVEKQHSEAVTSAMLGGFRTRQSTREEFLKLIRAGSSHPR
jgi:GTP cyclohydrolase IA